MLKIKRDDEVIVLAGKDRGKRGKVQKVLDNNKLLVSGVNMVKKHDKPSAANPQGGITEKEAPIHVSNLSLIDPKSGEATRVGSRMEDGKKVRVAKKSNQVL